MSAPSLEPGAEPTATAGAERSPARRLRIALAIHRLSLFGGLQRDALRTASKAASRGHAVTFLTTGLTDDIEVGGAEVRIVDAQGRTNHARAQRFSEAALALRGDADVVLGFDACAGLDLYFAGDRCYVERIAATRGPLTRWTPRYRTLARLERAVFAPETRTRVLLLAPLQEAVYRRWYGTPADRFRVLPPGIDPTRRRGPDHAAVREHKRSALGVAADEPLVLFLGSDFARKGLDRAIAAVAAIRAGRTPALAVAGDDDIAPFARRAAPSVRLLALGPRRDVPELLQAADALLHPARTEAAGAVLLEALAAGTPVVASDVCGYAPWIERSGAGEIVPSEDDPARTAAALARVLDDDGLSGRALAFVEAHPELFTMHARIVDEIERCAAERARSSP